MLVKKSVDYRLYLKLNKGPSYDGLVEVDFTTTNASGDLFIDYNGKTISSLVLNGKSLSPSSLYNGLFIKLPV